MRRRRQTTPPKRRSITVRIDPGLSAYIRAMRKGIGFWFSDKDLIQFLLRNEITERYQSDTFLPLIIPHLPPDMQKGWSHRFVPRQKVKP